MLQYCISLLYYIIWTGVRVYFWGWERPHQEVQIVSQWHRPQPGVVPVHHRLHSRTRQVQRHRTLLRSLWQHHGGGQQVLPAPGLFVPHRHHLYHQRGPASLHVSPNELRVTASIIVALEPSCYISCQLGGSLSVGLNILLPYFFCGLIKLPLYTSLIFTSCKILYWVMVQIKLKNAYIPSGSQDIITISLPTY